MGDKTGIEWTDHTFNPWIGCTKVSPGCAHCYAETEDKRHGWTPDGWGKGKPRKRTSAAYWRQPLKWNREAELWGAFDCGTMCCKGTEWEMRNKVANELRSHRGWTATPLAARPRVFCASLADVFDPEVPDRWRWDLIALINQTPNLDWQLLTKRPRDAMQFLARVVAWPFPNVWLGVSAEDQERFEERVRLLLSTPAAVRFVSFEPLLGPIDANRARVTPSLSLWIDWAIIGGESGKGARPCNVQWIRQLTSQCQTAGVAVFVKQLGAQVQVRNKAFDFIDTVRLHDRKGGDWSEWPEDLRVRQFPLYAKSGNPARRTLVRL